MENQGKTIKQIADELGVSKQAVRNEIAKQKLQSNLQKSGNQIFVNNAVEILIKSAFLKRQSTKLSENTLQYTSANKSDEVYELRSKVKMLQLELKLINKSEQEKFDILKKELEVKNKQIEDLNARLAETQQLLAQSQQLHAGTIQQQLTDGEHLTREESQDVPVPATAPGQAPTKKSWKWWK